MSFVADVTVIFDTDVLVWAERGNENAIECVGDAAKRALSVMTYMELLQGARGPKESDKIKTFISEGNFTVFPLTENIGHRASIYIEEYASYAGLRVGDAIIAATAIENNLVLATGNKKHFDPIKDLQLYHFNP